MTKTAEATNVPHMLVEADTCRAYKGGRTSYATQRSAKAARTRLKKKLGAKVPELEVWSVSKFNLIGNRTVEMKTVKSLMNGAEVQIPVDAHPACDPSTELYWSM